MQWFRFYSRTLNSPKVQKLPAETFKFWVNALCVASEHEGNLPDVVDLAFFLRLDEAAVLAFMQELIRVGLLEHTENGYRPHDWDEHQYVSDTSTSRVRKHREKKKKPGNTGDTERNEGETFHETQDETPRNVSETAPDTDTDTDTDIIIITTAREDPPERVVTNGFVQLRDTHWPRAPDLPAPLMTIDAQAASFLKTGVPPDVLIGLLTDEMARLRETSTGPPKHLGVFKNSLPKAIRAYKDAQKPVEIPDGPTNRDRFQTPGKPSRDQAVLDALSEAGG